MCGISGLFDLRGERHFEQGLIHAMNDRIAHRGPDGEGFHREAGVAFGHRRLSIIDLVGGAQPMSTADEAVTIVFNGEIYNYLVLKAELEAHGAHFRTNSDTEVLLHGWREWGEGLLENIKGMFAFALWDRSEKTLLLARDRFGKKPLHYGISADGVLAFSSEIKGLRPVDGLDRRLNKEAVADFFAYGYIPDPKTIFEGVRKLPPAHAMIVRRGGEPRVFAYWNLISAMPPRQDPTPEEFVEKLLEATRSRLISDVPLGALLSGGVDSSAIVSLMSELSSEPVNTFSIAFSEKAFDESAHALAVSERYGTHHDIQTVDASDFSQLPRLSQIYDEPFGDLSALPTLAVCAQARKRVTVALTGDGGDEALGGYRRYAFQLAEERIRGLAPLWLRRPMLGFLADIYPRAAWLPRPLRAKATLRELSLDASEAYFHSVSALSDEAREGLLSEEFRLSLGGYRPAEILRQAYNVDAKLDPLQRTQYADVQTWLPGDILVKVDRASMANGLELRAPLLDPDFFAWAFSLPTAFKLSLARGGKALMKEAMESRLPHDVMYRPKQGFTIPVAEWFRGPLRRDIEGLCSRPSLKESGVLDMSALANLVKDHVSGAADNSRAIWLAWVFAEFLQAQV